jgi:uncharacterized membrane protein YjjP (DUF1212 family)
MSEPGQQLAAYLATLATLLLVFVAALAAATISPALVGKIEAFGLGTITGGLIGVLRLPNSRPAARDHPPEPPVSNRKGRS